MTTEPCSTCGRCEGFHALTCKRESLDLASIRRRVVKLQVDAQEWSRAHRHLHWAALLPRDVARLLEGIDWLERFAAEHEADQIARKGSTP